MSTDITKWADSAMYEAEPMEALGEFGPETKVHLLWMTPDPLGAMAAFNEIYRGVVIRSLADVTDEMRQRALDDMQKTHLQAPMETIKLHFLIEGVSRSCTHQMVRQRTAVFAQESLRFAVKGPLKNNVVLPPSLRELGEEHPARKTWDRGIQAADDAYHGMIDLGIPAEDARDILPNGTATRIHYVTDLRNLVSHAGNRLCTQAQFHWRRVFNDIVAQVRAFRFEVDLVPENQMWQFEAIANSAMFRPVCYQIGKCPFNGSADRHCQIRDRVEDNAKIGRPSHLWGISEVQLNTGRTLVRAINPAEWLLDPTAARK